MNFKGHLIFFYIGISLFFSNILFSQKQNYTGPYKVGKFTGQVNYDYNIIDKDTILNGAFKMSDSDLDLLINEIDSSFLFEGTFDNSYPSGNWLFQFGEFKTDKSSQLVDYQYVVNINGIQEEAKGEIQKGKPHGTWLYTVNHILDSQIEKISFKSSIEFVNGVPQKNFSIENEDNTLVGRFLRNGLAHDQWSLYSSSFNGANEDWVFNNGFLKKVKKNDNPNVVIPVFSDEAVNSKTINLDALFLSAVQLQITINGDGNFQHGNIQKLLAQNTQYYKKIDSILSELGKSKFLPELKVKVPFFPLEAKEKELISSINEDYNISKKISEEILSNTQLNILKLSDSESYYLYNLVSEIKEAYLEPINKILSYDNVKIIEFVPRKRLLQNLWPNTPSTKISVFNDLSASESKKSFECSSSNNYNFNGEINLEMVNEIATYSKECILSIEKKIFKKLSTEKREKDLIELEKSLIDQNIYISSYIDSTSTLLDKEYISTLNFIKQKSKKQLSNYANEANKDLKLKIGKSILNCNETYIEITNSLVNLPKQVDTIQNLYKDRVWNPFTATLMSEEIKKPISNAYSKILIPYYLQQIESDLECTDLEPLKMKMETSYANILKLREKQTKKLERKLKREKKPDVIIDLLKYYVNTKEQ